MFLKSTSIQLLRTFVSAYQWPMLKAVAADFAGRVLGILAFFGAAHIVMPTSLPPATLLAAAAGSAILLGISRVLLLYSRHVSPEPSRRWPSPAAIFACVRMVIVGIVTIVGGVPILSLVMPLCGAAVAAVLLLLALTYRHIPRLLERWRPKYIADFWTFFGDAAETLLWLVALAAVMATIMHERPEPLLILIALFVVRQIIAGAKSVIVFSSRLKNVAGKSPKVTHEDCDDPI